jgi:hypothetical protein
MRRIISAVFCTAAFAALAYSATIQTIPSSGLVGGLPGTAVGWGFLLTNNAASDWVLLTDSYFTGDPAYGTYQDYVVVQFYVAGPGSSLQQAWDPSLGLGLGEFDISKTDRVRTSIPGAIGVDYSVFSQNPNDPDFNPDTSFVTSGTFFATADVLVTPEPVSLLLLGGGMLTLGFALLRRRRTRRS